MTEIDRRAVLAGAVAAAVAAGTPAARAEPVSGPGFDRLFGAVAVHPEDARYEELVVGVNKRWVASPESVRLVGSTEQVLQVVQEAVSTGKRLSVRSGGHCYADFVCHPDTDLILDVSGMNRISYDPLRRAFEVQSGAQLGRIYETLYKGWGVTIPGGACLTVGIGGHASGGGFGLLTRKFGLVADHLEAVEAVVVDRAGRARVVTASRSAADPNNDLWWAATGGGGGSFGVVTRFWFRSADATGDDPGRQLPAPPKEVLISSVGVPWSRLDVGTFSTLVRNFTEWHEVNGGVDSPFINVAGFLLIRQGAAGGVGLFTQVDGTDPAADRLLADYLAAITRGTALGGPFPSRRVPWLASTKLVATSNPTLLYDHTLRSAVKTAYLRRSFTDGQLATIHRHMTRADYSSPGAAISLNGGAGRLNTVPPAATASAHRDATFIALYENFWIDRAEDAVHLGWLRDIYHETFAATGGYPVPNEQSDGCYINDPDPDITDPAFNRSGVPWQTLYWKGNYPRLQQAKARWDPTDFFRHSQSVRLP